MMEAVIFTLGFFGAVLLVLSGVLFEKKREEASGGGANFLCFALGVILIVAMGILVNNIKDGSPAAGISPGVYKVGFVYHAGGNVNVGVEKHKKRPYEKTEQLFLYQLPAKDFESEIRTSAKKLTAYKLTTSEGTFNRYKLE